MKRELKGGKKCFVWEKVECVELVGILIGIWPKDFLEKEKREAPGKALAELRRQRIGIKTVTAKAGEIAGRRLVTNLPLTTAELVEALTLNPVVAEAAWSRLLSERIDEIGLKQARDIMSRAMLFHPSLREQVRKALLPRMRKLAA